MKSLDEIRADLVFIKDFEVVVFGSYANKKVDKRSDIDVAVITREKDRNKDFRIWENSLAKTSDIYDIKIFELLPLNIQASLIEKYEVVFGDRLDISEYFYEYKKRWDDTKHRIIENQFRSVKEKIHYLENYSLSHNGRSLTNELHKY